MTRLWYIPSHCKPNVVPNLVVETNIVYVDGEVTQTEENLVTLEKSIEPSLSTLDVVTDHYVADPYPPVIEIDCSKVVLQKLILNI